MNKIVAMDDSEPCRYPTKRTLERVGYEVQTLLDPSAFHLGIFGAPDHVSEAELAKAAGPCGVDGYIAKAWGVEQLIARIQLALGHDRSGAE